MPIYSYKCSNCQSVQDMFTQTNQKNTIKCVECHSTAMERYFGNSNVNIHGFTQFKDPRGSGESYTMSQIKNIEKNEGLTYLSHSEHDKEITKNRKARELKQQKHINNIAEKATKQLMNKWNH